jgi:hypothetical protein
MEDIHGVDVSWLHHSNRGKRIPRTVVCSVHIDGSTNEEGVYPFLTPGTIDKHNGLHAPVSPGFAKDPPPPVSHHGASRRNDNAAATPTQSNSASGTLTSTPTPQPSTTSSKTAPRRPGLLGRTSAEKVTTQSSPDGGNKIGPRRNSWISNISSKFSSQSPQQHGNVTPNGNANQSPQNARQPSPAPAAKPQTKEELEPYVPQPPKTATTSFFSSALRRLSSNTNIGPTGKVVPNAGMCPRRVLNIDHNRPRCLLPELDQSKLRRVAFCVDVEIAGGPRYKDEADGCEKKKKQKDKKLKEKGEGEALKHPQDVVDEKEKTGVVEASGEFVGTDENPDPEGTVCPDEKKDSTRKKEKKKRSEEERKERKEQKRRKAEESGAIPLQYTRDAEDSGQTSPTGATTPRPTDRPTTDPLRIYRRCCQLRESPVLKRITEQLGRPNACPVATPGVVSCLDLTGSRLQFADIMTLSDWLAIVPVKKLILEDSELTDEGVRVILAGLLAARGFDYPRRSQVQIGNSEKSDEERTGVVEKLSLKNNTKITKEGWKHICLFIYMCKSLKALDVSLITLPPSQAQEKEGQTTHLKPDHFDPAEILSKAISERLGGDRFEELIMAECSLTALSIRKIVDGVTVSGLKRLGLAGNHIDSEGLEHIIRYIRSGVCQGLDLGGNDMRNCLERLSDSFHNGCPLWALSLADCNLTPAALKPLFPGLMKLPNLRFLDLSHNHDLFSKQPSALGLLRKYMPILPMMKRLHLIDVSMTPAQAIALAEVLPECPMLAHLNLLQNPLLSALASATDEETQEEACALYASLMAAARVSTALICVDIDVPASDNSEIVKALAKQVVAYCLRNMERLAAEEAPDASEGSTSSLGFHDDVDVPEVLLHLVGNIEGHEDPHPDDPAPNSDYIVGGTGVVKALSYCLSEKASELRTGSYPTSGTTTPREHDHPHDHLSASKAKQMSKNLLESARKVRARLQPALVREAKAADDMAYRMLILSLIFLFKTNMYQVASSSSTTHCKA